MTPAVKPVPKTISRFGLHDVLVDWSDGHRSLFRARELRLGCRCASCVEEMTGRNLLEPASVALDVHPLAIEPVGRYAVHFSFSDGHTSGITTFEHLRSLCRCAECRPGDPDPVNPPVQEARPMVTLTPRSTMQQVLEAYPAAQKSLFSKYHIGGCSSCGFQPTDTIEAVCKNHDITDVASVIKFIQESDQQEKKMQISPQELKALLEHAGSVRLIDVRSPQEAERASIAGGQLVTDELSDEILNRWPKDAPIVVYCHLGERSLQAAGVLSDRGFTNVRSLTGGIDGWAIHVDPTVPRYMQMAGGHGHGGGGCKG